MSIRQRGGDTMFWIWQSVVLGNIPGICFSIFPDSLSKWTRLATIGCPNLHRFSLHQTAQFAGSLLLARMLDGFANGVKATVHSKSNRRLLGSPSKRQINKTEKETLLELWGRQSLECNQMLRNQVVLLMSCSPVQKCPSQQSMRCHSPDQCMMLHRKTPTVAGRSSTTQVPLCLHGSPRTWSAIQLLSSSWNHPVRKMLVDIFLRLWKLP